MKITNLKKELQLYFKVGIKEKDSFPLKVVKTLAKVGISLSSIITQGFLGFVVTVLYTLTLGAIMTGYYFPYWWVGIPPFVLVLFIIFLVKFKPTKEWLYENLTREWVVSQVGNP
jgi:hypothetical protein